MSNKLAVVDQREVPFYEDSVTAVIVEVDGRQQVFVPIRPICEALGIDWSAQRQRIERDLILSEIVMSVGVTTTDIDKSSRRPRSSSMLALPLDYLNGWLFGINATRVKEVVRPALLRYQRECYRVLYEATQEGRLSLDNDFSAILDAADPETVTMYNMALATVKLIRQQMIMESKIADNVSRIERLEERLDTAANVTDEEASQISQAVKAIALASPEKNFGAIYGELYRREGVTSYKNIKRTRYKAVLKWLTEWFQALTDDEVPF